MTAAPIIVGLPRVATPLIGRAELVRRVLGELQIGQTRLLTLQGPGGIGKTRVALAVADGGVAAGFDEVVIVPLAATAFPELVPVAVAATLGVEGVGEQPLEAQIVDRLTDHPTLLVLDNLEHLLDAGPFVSRLLEDLPDLSILLTSRAPLHLTGERVLAVPPLALPESADAPDAWEAPAIRLFVERARDAGLAPGGDEESLHRIIALCRRLDGLPLAIELAARGGSAEWSLTQPVEDRQQTMSAAVAWSYHLLAPDEQQGLRRLSGFAGSFSLDAVIAICDALDGIEASDPVAMLVALIDQSLVLPLFDHAGETRGAMLQTIAEFAQSELQAAGEADAFFAAHAAWVLGFAERAEPELRGADQARWVQRIDAELANVRQAIEWFRARDRVVEALRLTTALGWYWSSPGHFHEGRDLYDRLLAEAGDAIEPALRAKALESAGDIDDWLMDLPRAQERYEEAAEIHRRLGDAGRFAALQRALGSIALGRSDLEQARRLFGDAIEGALAAGDRWNYAASSNFLGVTRAAQGAYDEAIELCARAVATWSQLGDTGHFVSGSSAVAVCGIAAGRYALARDAAEAAVIGADRLDDAWDRARAITMTGGLLIAAGRYADGVRMLGYGEAVMSSLGTPLTPWMASQVDSYRVIAGEAIGGAELAWQTAIGAALSTEKATEEAIAALTSLRDRWPDEQPARLELSRRERDVLALLAQGKTDREIADALFIERRTVSKHVAAILEKLNVPNRSAAAALGLRLGIV